jgi:hypothetical protein
VQENAVKNLPWPDFRLNYDCSKTLKRIAAENGI